MKFDLLIRNATVIDGTRAPRFAADVGVSSGKISRIGKLKEKGEIEIDACGRIAAPGFIDAHTHDDRLRLWSPARARRASPGGTTGGAGNCAGLPGPGPRGMPRPGTRRLNLMAGEGPWFTFNWSR